VLAQKEGGGILHGLRVQRAPPAPDEGGKEGWNHRPPVEVVPVGLLQAGVAGVEGLWNPGDAVDPHFGGEVGVEPLEQGREGPLQGTIHVGGEEPRVDSRVGSGAPHGPAAPVANGAEGAVHQSLHRRAPRLGLPAPEARTGEGEVEAEAIPPGLGAAWKRGGGAAGGQA